MDLKLDIRSMNNAEIEKNIVENGFKKFRAKQIFDWVQKGVTKFEDMKNLPKPLIEYLEGTFILDNIKVVELLKSKDDGTQKFLFKLNDNHVIEAVYMKYKHGNSICISTQVGCRMGCSFCASTKDGLVRNVKAGEMLGQIWAVQEATNSRISNVVLMGSGEPLDNFVEVERFLNLVNDERGLNIGMRHITLSTCGMVPEIELLSQKMLQITLAISLHAPNDKLRTEMMPINRKYPIADLLEACRKYIEHTNRRITFEYALVEGVNDSEDQARELASILKNINCHVNLIPVNPIVEEEFKPSKKLRIDSFKATLLKSGINATVRRELGIDIDAACGQLRKRYMDQEK